MFDMFVLDKLDSQSANLTTVVKSEDMEKLDFNFIITLREMMHFDVSSIIFSNHYLKYSLPLWYVLRLDRDKIELLEIKNDDHTNVLLYFQSNKIYFNGKEHNDLLRNDFKKRLRSILIDLRKDKCKVYEEKI